MSKSTYSRIFYFKKKFVVFLLLLNGSYKFTFPQIKAFQVHHVCQNKIVQIMTEM